MPAVGEKQYLTVQVDYHKAQIPLEDILYITIEGRKTKITRKGNPPLRTNRSLKDIYEELPGAQFDSINRGIVVAKAHIKSDKDGLITMTDGQQFKRRVRSDRVREKPTKTPEPRSVCPAEVLDQWLARQPQPICILELVYHNRGGGAEFLLRYCNKAMEDLEHIRFSEVRDKPVTCLPGVGNPKWLTGFADVAINGTRLVMEDLRDSRFFRIHCYQPQSGFCALVLTDLTRENNLVQELFQRGR